MSPPIPNRLLSLPWVGWRKVSVPGRTKPAKVPINPRTGENASVTNPRTWGDFPNAVAAVPRFQLDGYGVVLTHEGGLTGVDLDNCLDPTTGDLVGQAALVLDMLPGTYAERSPSGLGIRMFVEGLLPVGSLHRVGNLEAYDDVRFMTVTGAILPDRPLSITDAEGGLAWLVAKYLTPPPTKVMTVVSSGYAGDDEGLLRRAIAHPITGPRLAAFLSGRVLDHKSQSGADYELCRLLGFWCGGDPVRVEVIARSSGAYRDKWDERRGCSTWLALTVRKALSRLACVHVPGSFHSHKIQEREDKECATLLAPCDSPSRVEKNPLIEHIRRLRLIHGRPVGLSVRQASSLLGIHVRTAANWLKALVAEQRLICVTKGTYRTRLASEFDLPEFVKASDSVPLSVGRQHPPPYTRTPGGLFAVWWWSPRKCVWLHFGDCIDRESAIALAGQHMGRLPGWWSVGDELNRYYRGRGLRVRRHISGDRDRHD
jgi:putative DNA primase/helicase